MRREREESFELTHTLLAFVAIILSLKGSRITIPPSNFAWQDLVNEVQSYNCNRGKKYCREWDTRFFAPPVVERIHDWRAIILSHVLQQSFAFDEITFGRRERDATSGAFLLLCLDPLTSVQSVHL